MILVYGGSFNPPTIAHLEIIDLLNKKLNPEKLIILPVGNKYTWKDNLIPFTDRMNMLRILTKDILNIEISDLENTNTYEGTFETLTKISQLYQTKDVYFVFGADNVEFLTKWMNYEALLKTFGFVIIKRKSYELNLEIFKKFKTNHYVLEFDSEVSSTHVRSNIEKYRHYLTNEVYQYIKEKSLYKGE